MKNLKISLLTVLLGVSAVTPAFAKPDISLVMETKKVTMKEGKEVLSDIKAVRPGDTIQYTIKVTNKGDSAALEVEPTGDIPSNTIYVPENNFQYKAQYSIDNGVTFQDVPKITIKEKGKNIVKNAPVDMYRKIKWMLKKVNPKESYDITYKVKVK